MKHTAILAALLACAATASHAQDQIATDRPDFVESSNVVGDGRLQVETSLLLERDRQGAARDRTVSTPTLLRYGMGESFELRVETDGRIDQRSTLGGARERAKGYADTSVGVKWHAMDAAGSLPSVGVLLHADLDSGSRAFRGDGVRPSLRVVGEWELPDDYSLGIMPGVGVERGEAGRYRHGILGVVVGKAINERLRGFAEVAMPQIARSAHGGTQASFDVGGAYLLSDTVQVDAMLSRGLNSRTPDLAFTVGLSFKL
ncbi:transporter [Massilia yuzhufengensis]|uniref:Putative MetA-pathway of phenol degradation n=1 Tax=Massilia yuzhufengensis TaxID=1164594 RepID=A0A1I1EXE8_9BURK|nr:transporter [Massilia yuzhufengensis]SFB91332.1 Putative MetA-pathway of phenol degradation [Massilia yuzhufengensis]